MKRVVAFMNVPDHMTDRDVQAMLAAELPRLFAGDLDVTVYSSAEDMAVDLEAGVEAVGATAA